MSECPDVSNNVDQRKQRESFGEEFFLKRLPHDRDTQMLASHSTIYFISRIVPAILYFVLIGVFTRLLSPTEFGTYSFVIATTTFAMTTLNLWLCTSAVRMINRDGTNQNIMSAIFVGFILVLILASSLAVGIYFFLEDDHYRNLLILAFCLFATSTWLDVNLHILQGLIRPASIAYLAIARGILSAAISVPLAYYGWGTGGIILGTFIGNLIPTLFVTWGLWRGINVWQIDHGTFKRMAAYGIPLSVSYVVAGLIYTTDRFAITALEGAELLGFYAAGYEIANRLIRALTDPIGAASLPLAIEALESGGREAAVEQLGDNHVLLVGIGLPASLGLIAVSPELVAVALGSEFRVMAMAVLPIVAFSTMLSSFRAHYLDHAFHLSLKTRTFLYVMIGIGALNGVLNIWFIQSWGIVGAAYATLIAQSVGVVLCAVVGSFVFPLPFRVIEMSKIAVAAIAMLLAITLLPGPATLAMLILKVVVGGTLYTSFILALDPGNLRQRLRDLLDARRHSEIVSQRPELDELNT